MYFEDIFRRVEPLWKRHFSLDEIEKTETYVIDIRNDYNRIERVVDLTQFTKYSEWESMLIFTMYQTITSYALHKWKNDKTNVISLKDISIQLFEEQFRKNLEPQEEFEGNDEFKKEYQGFRSPHTYI